MSAYTAKRVLLSGIIDYAGTFPPAALDLSAALREAATFRNILKRPWLVSRVVLKLTDLKLVTSQTLIENGANGIPWIFSALGGSPEGVSSTDIARLVEWELREITRFNSRGLESSCRSEIVSYELRLPPDAIKNIHTVNDARTFLGPILERFAASKRSNIQLYLEVPSENLSQVENIGDALCIWSEEEGDSTTVPGMKIRTGGQRIPALSELAHFVNVVISRGLRFKATQGLHSALTHEHDFGFVNLIAALNFAQAIGGTGFSQRNIESLLAESDPGSFSWTIEAVRWREFSLTREQIETARRHHGGCFGSCSIIEPDDSLEQTFSDRS